MNLSALPFNAHLGLRQSEAADALLELPAHARNANHLGTVHASAQMALAEAASGEFLLRQLGGADGLLPVVRRFEAKFRHPANGTLRATAHFLAENALADFHARGRTLVSIAVDVHDAAGAHTLSATVEWFLQRLPAP